MYSLPSEFNKIMIRACAVEFLRSSSTKLLIYLATPIEYIHGIVCGCPCATEVTLNGMGEINFDWIGFGHIIHVWWWRHQMETFSALLALCVGNSPVTGKNSPHKGQWRGALMFLWSAPWINDWVNNSEAGDLRRHRAHYDVFVMRVIYSFITSKIASVALRQANDCVSID